MTVIPLTPDSPASHAVGVDFDQTLVDHPTWRDGAVYGHPLPGAIDALRALMAIRSVFVFTARHPRTHRDVARWLEEHVGCPVIVDTEPGRAYWLGDELLVTNKKLGAACYIDDRALRFEGDWVASLAQARRAIGLTDAPPASEAPPADLPALTIRQPWLAAILAGDKRVENRSWPTKYRGFIALHAARALSREGRDDPLVQAVLARPGAPALTTGALVATARITDCHRDIGCCRPWGQPGLYHWTLADVRPLPEPIPATGRLGLWHPDPALRAQLHHHAAPGAAPR